MSCGAKYDITICKGKTFSEVYRWEAGPIIYKAVTAVVQTTPLRLTVPSHGFPDGWRLALSAFNGMIEVNAKNPPRASDYHRATVIDANTIEFNDINAADFGAYTSGGYVQGNTPVSIASYTAELIVEDAERDGDELVDWSANVTIDNTAKTITFTVSATATAALAFEEGWYELVLTSPGGVKTPLLQGRVRVVTDVVE
jgi:hypothetical protein